MAGPRNIRLFVKPYCGWCRQARQWLEGRGIAYELLDVTADRAAYEEMVRLSGQTLAPVIQVGTALLADFGAEELEAFWARLPGKAP